MPPADRTEVISDDDFATKLEEFRVYLQYRVPTSFAAGGAMGGNTTFFENFDSWPMIKIPNQFLYLTAATGYYIGDAIALYGYMYGFGLGIAGTLFYSGVYGLKTIRQTDDAINYGVSGAVNAGILVSLHTSE